MQDKVLPRKPKKPTVKDVKALYAHNDTMSLVEAKHLLDDEYDNRYQKWIENCILTIAKYSNIEIPSEYDETPYNIDIIL